MVVVIEQDKLLWLVAFVIDEALARQGPIINETHVTNAFSASFVIAFVHGSFFKAKKHWCVRAGFG
jgi:uncharacterized membrane protein (Fun14 family)